MASKRRSKTNKQRKKELRSGYEGSSRLNDKQFQKAKASDTTYSARSFPISGTGFIALRTKTKKTQKSYYLEQLVGPESTFNFALRKWDALDPLPILDTDQRVIGVGAGKPKNDETWDDVHRRAASLLENARHKLHFDAKERQSRRGKFPAINVGISHGGGQPYPKTLEQNPKNAPILEELMADDSFHRISGFAAGAFSTWAPRLYQYENDCLTNIINKDEELRRENKHPSPQSPSLRRNWSKTPWAAAALNFGPQTICYKHADYRNLAFGWCCITALGDYDYKTGGHLILWDLKLVIEFPPGATILIPSSAVHHSNTRIHQGEHRYSFTQYSAGGLFRWMDNDYQTAEAHRRSMTSKEVASHLQKLADQLEFGLSLYSTVEEIEKARGVSIQIK